MKETVLTCLLSERIKRRAPSTQADSDRDWRRKPVEDEKERKAKDWEDSQKRRLTISPVFRLESNLHVLYYTFFSLYNRNRC